MRIRPKGLSWLEAELVYDLLIFGAMTRKQMLLLHEDDAVQNTINRVVARCLSNGVLEHTEYLVKGKRSKVGNPKNRSSFTHKIHLIMPTTEGILRLKYSRFAEEHLWIRECPDEDIYRLALKNSRFTADRAEAYHRYVDAMTFFYAAGAEIAPLYVHERLMRERFENLSEESFSVRDHADFFLDPEGETPENQEESIIAALFYNAEKVYLRDLAEKGLRDEISRRDYSGIRYYHKREIMLPESEQKYHSRYTGILIGKESAYLVYTLPAFGIKWSDKNRVADLNIFNYHLRKIGRNDLTVNEDAGPRPNAILLLDSFAHFKKFYENVYGRLEGVENFARCFNELHLIEYGWEGAEEIRRLIALGGEVLNRVYTESFLSGNPGRFQKGSTRYRSILDADGIPCFPGFHLDWCRINYLKGELKQSAGITGNWGKLKVFCYDWQLPYYQVILRDGSDAKNAEEIVWHVFTKEGETRELGAGNVDKNIKK